jgi:hypothetical protein
VHRVDLAASLTSHLLFRQPPLHYSPRFSPAVSVILEVNRVRLRNGEPDSGVETCAYTVLPLFNLRKEVPCVAVGRKEVRLVEGEFGKRELASLEANPTRYSELLEGQKGSELAVEVRVLNGYFERQWACARVGNKGKPLRSIFQNSKGFKSAQEAIGRIIKDTYGVDPSEAQ